jgi:hypothetical protein
VCCVWIIDSFIRVDYARYALSAEERIEFEKIYLAPAQIPRTTQEQARELFSGARVKLFRYVLGSVV